MEILEFTLVFLPLLGFTCLIIDMGWAIYVRSTLQYAVRQGCRYAVTSQYMPAVTDTVTHKTLGHYDSIRYKVATSAMGTLGAPFSGAGWSKISVNFYDPSNLTTPLAAPTSSASTKINVGGNIVEVVVSGFSLAPMLPILRSSAALSFTARSSDRMEASPVTIPPYAEGGAY